MTINNATATHAAVWASSSTTDVMALYGTYGAGRFAAIGDSSVVEDATSSSGTTYAGWTTPVDNGYCALNGTVWILNGSGTTLTAPTATTGAASSIGTTTATLNGTVIPGGQSTTAQFQYGPTTSYGSIAPVSGTFTGTTAQAVSANLTGLTPGTTYHFRATASNASGSTNGLDAQFTTTAPDLAILATHTGNFIQGDNGDTYTIIVTNVGNAASGGTVTVVDTLPAGLTATAISGASWNSTLGTLTCTRSDALAAGAAYPAITVTVNVSAGAAANVTNTATVSGGNDINSANNTATDPTSIIAVSAPTATTGAATGVGTTTATLNGTVNPNGLSTTAQFQYGLTTAYGTTNLVSGALTGTATQPVTTSLTGLSPGMTYHFLVSATNTLGAASGSDQTFSTTALVPDLAVAMSHTGNFTQGDAADAYTIIVTNLGTAASSGTVTVTDTPPSALTITLMSGSGWSHNSSAATCTRSDALGAGAAYPPITVTVAVSASAPASVTNVATVSGGGENNTANDIASDPTTINSSGGGVSYAGILAGWDVSGQTDYGTSPLAATNTAPNLTVGGLTRGSGVTTSGTAAGRAWGGNNFVSTSESAATNANQFATFSITANAGYKVSVTNISRLDYKRSNGGPPDGALQYQVGSGAFQDVTALSYTSTTGASLGPIDLSGITALQNVGPGITVTFRIVSWGTSNSGGNWYIFDVANSTADDLEIQGTVVATCSSPTALTPTASPASTVCAGTAVTLTANATGGSAPYTYQWKTNGVAISGATGSTYSIASPTVADARNYSVDITSSCGGTASTSPALALTVNAIPSTPTAGNNGPVCAGSALTLSTPTVSGATYSWTGPNGFTSSSQNPTVSSSAAAGMSGTYHVTVAVGGCPSAAGSTAVTVNPAPVGGAAIPTAATVFSGTGTNITLTGQTGSIVKWQSSTNGSNWSDIASTANPLPTGTLTQTTEYRAVVQSGVCTTAASSVATVNVTALVAPTLSGVEKVSATSIKLTFSGPQYQTYKVLETTNVTQLLSSWNALTNGTFGTGLETFTDTSATDAARFYRITSP